MLRVFRQYLDIVILKVLEVRFNLIYVFFNFEFRHDLYSQNSGLISYNAASHICWQI